MTPLVVMTSSSDGYPRGLLVLLFIQRPSKAVMLCIIGGFMQNNMSSKMTLSKSIKV